MSFHEGKCWTNCTASLVATPQKVGTLVRHQAQGTTAHPLLGHKTPSTSTVTDMAVRIYLHYCSPPLLGASKRQGLTDALFLHATMKTKQSKASIISQCHLLFRSNCRQGDSRMKFLMHKGLSAVQLKDDVKDKTGFHNKTYWACLCYLRLIFQDSTRLIQFIGYTKLKELYLYSTF